MILFDTDLTLERPCTAGREKTDKSLLLVSVMAWEDVTGHLHTDPHRAGLCGCRSKTASCALLPGITPLAAKLLLRLSFSFDITF